MDGIVITASYKDLFESILHMQLFNRVSPIDDTPSIEYESASETNTETLYEGFRRTLADVYQDVEQPSDPVGHTEQNVIALEDITQDAAIWKTAERKSDPVVALDQNSDLVEGFMVELGAEAVEESDKNFAEGQSDSAMVADKKSDMAQGDEILQVEAAKQSVDEPDRVQEEPHPTEDNPQEVVDAPEMPEVEQEVDSKPEETSDGHPELPVERPHEVKGNDPSSMIQTVTIYQSPFTRIRAAHLQPILVDRNLNGSETPLESSPQTPSPRHPGQHAATHSVESLTPTLVNNSPIKLEFNIPEMSGEKEEGPTTKAEAEVPTQTADMLELETSIRSLEGNEPEEAMTFACHELIVDAKEHEHQEELIALKEEHEDAIKALQEKVDSLASHKRALTKRVNKANEDKTKLQQSLQDLRGQAEQQDAAIYQLRAEVSSKDNAIRCLNGHIEAAAQREAGLRSQMQKLRSDLDRTRDELDRMVTEYEVARDENENTASLILIQRENRTRLERLATARGQEVENLQQNVTAYVAEQAGLQREVQHLTEKNRRLANEMARTERVKAQETIKRLEKTLEKKRDHDLKRAVEEAKHFKGKSADLQEEVIQARHGVLPVWEMLQTVTNTRDVALGKLKEQTEEMKLVCVEKHVLQARYTALLNATSEGHGEEGDVKRLKDGLKMSEDAYKRLSAKLAETRQQLDKSQRERKTAESRAKFLEEKVAVEVEDRARLTKANLELDGQHWELLMSKEDEEQRANRLEQALEASQSALNKAESLLEQKSEGMITLCLDRTPNGEILSEHFQTLIRNEQIALDDAKLIDQYLKLEKQRSLQLEKLLQDNQIWYHGLERVDCDLRRRLVKAEEGWEQVRKLKDELQKGSPMAIAKGKTIAALEKGKRACGRETAERGRELCLRAEALGPEDPEEEEKGEGPDFDGHGEFVGNPRVIPENRDELVRQYRILFDENAHFFRKIKNLSGAVMDYRAQAEGLKGQVSHLEEQMVPATEPEPAESTPLVDAQAEATIEGLKNELETAKQRVVELEGYVAGGIDAQALAAFSELEMENEALRERLGETSSPTTPGLEEGRAGKRRRA
ncbi:MAG: hypothetical protein M1816_001090 [Peltula sp. TS41687]|nr:MAG: hypothetical protein M1816_001090 [Peltula sp. TS41687]